MLVGLHIALNIQHEEQEWTWRMKGRSKDLGLSSENGLWHLSVSNSASNYLPYSLCQHPTPLKWPHIHQWDLKLTWLSNAHATFNTILLSLFSLPISLLWSTFIHTLVFLSGNTIVWAAVHYGFMWVAGTGCSARITPYFFFGLPSSMGIWDTSWGCPKFPKFCDPTEWQVTGYPQKEIQAHARMGTWERTELRRTIILQWW